MLHIKSLAEGLDVFKALGSEIRIEILRLLLENPELNLNELALKLNITNGALTSHIRKLEECGLITVSSESAGHGNQKKCTVKPKQILIDLPVPKDAKNIYQTEIKVGHFSDYEVFPTCGLASSKAQIGEMDDIRYFSHPDRYEADILWFSRGYVEYVIPNFIPASQKIVQLSLSLEISSEAPGVNNNWPSDIHFYLNGVFLGSWTSPGDFGDVKGLFTPDWWYSGCNQYGLLKHLVIGSQGTFIDGRKLSDVTIDQLGLTSRSILKFKMAVEEGAEHMGGLTIFGKTFGNYNQDIQAEIRYAPLIEE